MRIKIVPNERGVPQAKLADAEIVFDEEDVLCGLKLVGFAVWEGREGPHVTFPARPFIANGERRLYALLRPVKEPVRDADAQESLRQLIMQAFVDFHHQTAAQSLSTGALSRGGLSTGASSAGPGSTGNSPATGPAPLDEKPIDDGSFT